VFLEQIEYILVVSTPLEIILLGVAFSEPNSKGSRGMMSIYRTEMIVSSDNINMTQIVGTKTGRIFMRGSNGHMYELVYQVLPFSSGT
jgi:nuclear pore complex protein Nup155